MKLESNLEVGPVHIFPNFLYMSCAVIPRFIMTHCHSAVTDAEHISEVKLTTDSSYLAFTGEMYEVSNYMECLLWVFGGELTPL